jgi:hypothetical protein
MYTAMGNKEKAALLQKVIEEGTLQKDEWLKK